MGVVRCDFETIDRESALETLDKLIKKHPSSSLPILLKGELEIIQINYSQSKGCFVKAKEISSSAAEKIYCQLMLLWHDNDLDGMTILLRQNKSLIAEYPLAEYYLENLKAYLNWSAAEKIQGNESIANSLTSMYPSNSRFFILRGDIRYHSGRIQEAYEDYHKALEYRNTTINNEHLCQYYRRLGQVASELFKWEEALDHYNRSYELKSDPLVLFIVANIKYELNTYAEAINDFSKLISSGYKLQDCYFYRGLCFYYLNNPEGAKNDFNKIVELDSNDSRGLYGLGLMEKERDLSKAKWYFDKVKEISPGFVEAYLQLYDCYDLQTTSEDMSEFVKQNASLSNSAHMDPADLGRYNYVMEKYSEAIRHFTKAIEQDPNSSKNYYYRGLARAVTFDEDCVSDFNKSIALDANSPLGYFGKGLLKYNLNQYEDAVGYFSKAIDNNMRDDTAYAWKSYARFELEDYRGALSDINEAIKRSHNNNLTAKLKKVEILIHLDRLEEATSDLKEILLRYPNNDVAYLYSGIIEIANHAQEKAKVDFLKAIEINNKNSRAYYYLAQLEESKNRHQALIYYERAEQLGQKEATKEIDRLQNIDKTGVAPAANISVKEEVTGYQRDRSNEPKLPPSVDETITSAIEELRVSTELHKTIRTGVSEVERLRIDVASFLRVEYPKKLINPRELYKLDKEMQNKGKAFLKNNLGNSLQTPNKIKEVFRSPRASRRKQSDDYFRKGNSDSKTNEY